MEGAASGIRHARRNETLRGGLDHPRDETLHIVLFLLVYLDVDNIAGNGEIDKNDHSVHMGERFPFGGHRFDGHMLQFQVDFFLAHSFYK